MNTCVLIPCYNEVSNIGKVVKSALQYVSDVIVIDDGSTDGTGLAAERQGALLIKHDINKGKGESLKTGFEYIIKQNKWDAVIIMDGDGQHDPHEIPNFIKVAETSDASIVVGDRMRGFAPKNMPLIRRLTNKFTSFLISKIIQQIVYDSQCGYRLIKIAVLMNIKLYTSRFDTESEMLIQASKKGFKIGSAPIKSIYNDETSYINPVKDSIRFIKLMYGAIFRK